MTYLSFPTPLWMLAGIAALLAFVVLQTRVYGALAFFLASAYTTLIIKIGPTTLVPVAFGALVIAIVAHLRNPGAFRFRSTGKSILGTYLALMLWVLLRGWLGLQDSAADLQALLFLLTFVNLVPVLLADSLTWDDNAVQDFVKGFVAAVVLQMVVVLSRAIVSGLAWQSWLTDFWLTRWSSEEASPFVIVTGITNYHWYSWNLGLAVMAAVFVLRTPRSRFRPLYLAATAIFVVACVQQIALVGSRQSITALIVAALVTSWTRIRKALLNVGAFALASFLVLFALRALADLEPLPVALMHGADSVTEAFDPAMSRGTEWQRGLEAFLRAPLLGTGFASEEGFSLGHNIVINTVANLGIIGLTLLVMLVALYVTGPLTSVYNRKGARQNIDRGLVGMQLFLLGTSLASGSVVASSGIFWIGAIVIRRVVLPAAIERRVPVRERTPVPA
jgi:hypothetical protein